MVQYSNVGPVRDEIVKDINDAQPNHGDEPVNFCQVLLKRHWPLIPIIFPSVQGFVS